MAPEFGRTNTEITVDLRLVPEDNVLNLITGCVVAYNKTLIVRSTLIHDLTEKLKRGEGRSVVLKDTTAIVQIRLTQDEHVVDVCSQDWCYTKWVLHSNQEEDLHPATVQEEIADV